MKELSIEEKARRYDEAIERAKQFSEKPYLEDSKGIVEYIFPEFKESEDERIRQDIITTLSMGVACEESALHPGAHTTLKEAIAWFEKQGKNNMGISEATKKKLEDNLNNALEKETPESWNKFLDEQGEQNQKHFELKAGHWYICHRAYCCRADHLTVKEGERFMCEKDGVVKGFVIKEPEKYFKEVCLEPIIAKS